MSRSVRKTKIFGITNAMTEKQDKRRWNRTFRKVCKKLIRLEKEAPIKSTVLLMSGMVPRMENDT